MRPGNPTAAHAAFQVKGTYEYQADPHPRQEDWTGRDRYR
jgi:hypothetical protein